MGARIVMRSYAIVVALGFVLIGGTVHAGGAADHVKVSDPYVRAVPPGQPNSAAFMGLSNSSGQSHALVGAESEVAGTVELHTHTMKDGMMKMRRVERIEIPAGESVSLEPGGLHLMLIGLKEQLLPEQRVDLTLIFDDNSRTRVTAPVRKVETGVRARGKEHKCGGGRCGSGN